MEFRDSYQLLPAAASLFGHRSHESKSVKCLKVSRLGDRKSECQREIPGCCRFPSSHQGNISRRTPAVSTTPSRFSSAILILFKSCLNFVFSLLPSPVLT